MFPVESRSRKPVGLGAKPLKADDKTAGKGIINNII